MEIHQNAFQRLGKPELGPHAFEEKMPDRIAAAIATEDDSNTIRSVVHQLTKLLHHDDRVDWAYLCCEFATQTCKLSDEGNHFCGYRNIQMLFLALMAFNPPQVPVQSKPKIPDLQRMIENAWDKGFNPHGRVLTGGIISTRKYVGTSEAEALFISLNIPCIGHVFKGPNAWCDLLDSIEAYFSEKSAKTGVHGTNRPPIFLQRPRHSMTVVGIERALSGKRYLLVFDPAWRPPSAIRRPLKDNECRGWHAQYLHRFYRKSEKYLKRFTSFETLSIDMPA